MTKEQKSEISLINKAVKDIRNSKIHYSEMTSWNRSAAEGYNSGLEAAALHLEKKVKALTKKYL